MERYVLVYNNWIEACEQLATRSCPASKLLYPIVKYSYDGVEPKRLNAKQRFVFTIARGLIDETRLNAEKSVKRRINKNINMNNNNNINMNNESQKSKFDNEESLWRKSTKS